MHINNISMSLSLLSNYPKPPTISHFQMPLDSLVLDSIVHKSAGIEIPQ